MANGQFVDSTGTLLARVAGVRPLRAAGHGAKLAPGPPVFSYGPPVFPYRVKWELRNAPRIETFHDC